MSRESEMAPLYAELGRCLAELRAPVAPTDEPPTMYLSEDTLKWANSLPSPDDAEGWNKRRAAHFAGVLPT
jgi:hypothetical protein